MKKSITLFIVAAGLFIGTQVSAQVASGQRLGNVGFETGFALEDGWTIPLGATFKYEAPIAEQLHVTGTAGFISVRGEEIGGIDMPNLSYIPLKAGLKYYAAGNFYIDGEIGAGIGVSDLMDTEFLFAPGIGYSFPVSNNSFVDLSARYESVGKSVNNLGIRLGYSFAL